MEKKKVFYFIGPEKTGTSFIYRYLVCFAEVGLAIDTKETFVLKGANGWKKDFDRISNDPAKVVCFCEPSYFCNASALRNIDVLSAYFNITIIHTKRDPLDRSISHYLHHKGKGRVNGVLDAVSKYPEIIEASLYAKYMSKWKRLSVSIKESEIEEVTSNCDVFLNEVFQDQVVLNQGYDLGVVNERLSPRSFLISKLATWFVDRFRGAILNRLINSNAGAFAKRLIYYSGVNKLEVSSVEHREIEQLLHSPDGGLNP